MTFFICIGLTSSAMICTARAQTAVQWETPEYLKGNFLPSINAAKAYKQGYTGAGVLVGIIDTGIDAAHPEFAGKLLDGYDFVTSQPIVEGGNFSHGYHGTHVAGIVAARRNGVEMHGVAFNADIAMMGVADTTDDEISQAWSYAVAQGFSIINNSYSLAPCEKNLKPCNVTSYTRAEVAELFPKTIAQIPGILARDTLMVFSNGNLLEPDPTEMAALPYLFPEVKNNWIAVASLEEDNTISFFSSLCGVAKMYCISAPGRYIWSTVPYSYNASGYASKSGTSMASPVVAGTAALVKEAFPWFSAENLQQAILTTATDLGEPGVDEVYGWGLLDAGKAVRGYGMFVETAILDTRGHNATFSNDISGGAGLIKQGVGTLTLTGNNSYQGASLVLNGSLAVEGIVTSAVIAEEGGILTGGGTVGTTRIGRGGMIAPGSFIGTLKVAGDYVQDNTGTYAFEFNGAGGDLLQVSGKARLDGVLALLPRDDSFRLGTTYTVLTADDGVSGPFAGVMSALPFLSGQLVAGDDSVALTLAQARPFATVAQSGNQRAVADALDTLAPGLLQSRLMFLPTQAAARTAFEYLSGEAHASMKGMFIEQSAVVRDTLINRLRQVQDGALPQTVRAALDEGRNSVGSSFWAKGLAMWNRMDGSAGDTRLTGTLGGFLMGIDAVLLEDWRIGLAAGYSSTQFSLDRLASSGSSDNWNLGAYAGRQWGDMVLRTGAAMTWQDISTSRAVVLPTASSRFTAGYAGRLGQAFGELGWQVKTTFGVLEPFAGLAYVNLQTNGFEEAGGAGALFATCSNMDTAFTTIGLRGSANIQYGGITGRISAGGGWRHAFGDLTPLATQAFTGSSPFTVTGTPVANNALATEAALEIDLGSSLLSLAYTGQFGDAVTWNNISASWRLSF